MWQDLEQGKHNLRQGTLTAVTRDVDGRIRVKLNTKDALERDETLALNICPQNYNSESDRTIGELELKMQLDEARKNQTPVEFGMGNIFDSCISTITVLAD